MEICKFHISKLKALLLFATVVLFHFISFGQTNPYMRIEERFVNSNWSNYQKVMMTYNENNQLTIENYQNWNTSSGWRDSSKIIYTYDSEGKLLERLGQMWSLLTNSWEDVNRSVLIYDPSGKLITQLQQGWDISSSGDWETTGRITFEYDVNGFRTSLTNETVQSHQFRNNTRNLYHNTPEGKVDSIITQQWVNESWKNTNKAIITYTPTGKQATYNNFHWNEGIKD